MGLMHLANRVLMMNEKTLFWVEADKLLAEQLASSPFTFEDLVKRMKDSERLSLLILNESCGAYKLFIELHKENW